MKTNRPNTPKPAYQVGHEEAEKIRKRAAYAYWGVTAGLITVAAVCAAVLFLAPGQ